MIDAHDIRFSYDGPGGRRSLNGAQLHAAPGEFVAVLGHNGCGKSTLVKHFNALLPLQHGTLTVDGMDAADPANRWALRRKVGMVFQNPDNQFVKYFKTKPFDTLLELQDSIGGLASYTSSKYPSINNEFCTTTLNNIYEEGMDVKDALKQSQETLENEFGDK